MIRWTDYIHSIREQEFSIIKANNFFEGNYNRGLEIGAGDGFMSSLFSELISSLISIDINSSRIKQAPDKSNINYIVCDINEINSQFEGKTFDIIYSSNVLEHLSEPLEILKGINSRLDKEGITIHVLPNVFWKAGQVFLFYVQLFRSVLKKMSRSKSIIKTGVKNGQVVTKNNWGKGDASLRNSRVLIKLLPPVHGASGTHIEEIFAFRLERWLKLFNQAGLKVHCVEKGPISSGYGFGFDCWRTIFKKMGFCSEYIIFAGK